MKGTPIAELGTPRLLLDEQRMERNIAAMTDRLAPFDVDFRPHLKTAKSTEIARRLTARTGNRATVSTFHEAEQFATAGLHDILYAVGIAPDKLPRVVALRAQGIDLSIVLDSVEQARAVADAAQSTGHPIPALIEIDCDGRRGGVAPDDPAAIAIGEILQAGGAALRGVMTHASYGDPGAEAIERAAARERGAAVAASRHLRDAGLPCPVVSIGSTPTAWFARDLAGVTEVRAGVFVFHDLFMAGLGVCGIDDIALSVLATVIGRRRQGGELIVDAGWMALSSDRGTASQGVDQGYGLVCDLDLVPYPGLIVREANQEHGIVALRSGSATAVPSIPIGAKVRILPNHACATAAQHAAYAVTNPGGRVIDVWPRLSGW